MATSTTAALQLVPEADATLSTLHDMEAVISRVLQFGVVLSMSVVAVGVALWSRAAQAGAGSYPTTIGGVWAGAAAGQPLAVIQVGLLLLILTPVIRVAASVLVFARDGDRPFTIITVTVLALLLCGIFLGTGG